MKEITISPYRVSRFKIQEGLLTNAKVNIHVTIRIKVCHSDNDVFTILYIGLPVHDLQRNKLYFVPMDE